MTTSPTDDRFESEMLKLVREWRKQVYEEDRNLSSADRSASAAANAAELGLRLQKAPETDHRKSA